MEALCLIGVEVREVAWSYWTPCERRLVGEFFCILRRVVDEGCKTRKGEVHNNNKSKMAVYFEFRNSDVKEVCDFEASTK